MQVITKAELAKHNTPSDTWLAIHGLVYDCTVFMPDHPGGQSLIEDVGGQDASDEFEDALHSAASRSEAKLVLKGVLEGCEKQVASWRANGWDESQGIPDPEVKKGGLSVPPAATALLVVGAVGAAVAAWLMMKRRK
mmetsp:Transcript_847/g.1654  ORF Transcript_847/g.1654 Transcript_847/m.1654 type:complete len:137 (-) Transcript_847:210-620(-)|eukprot:CAMPEP_0197655378 /NCGR_PEP_ID=MMETSP1338-20131121/39419_1 /TAXON_ID=43686 ORGANISM="Pelagodinium beii, Strain RCC1491" /NCGR_SAMPLE_ID=MMETSP1338 /ASSEMBLY_ACC=CAM_ASM_000754 /LENGTH=136 /DNA_ID=CAMNT_0043231013 /DNA_START=57 /DNA_END=467 /DNA_ORIENTATION=-